jgi:hypothetical protein
MDSRKEGPCFVVRDDNSHAPAHFYFDDGQDVHSATKPLTRVAADVAKFLPMA